MNFFRLNSRQDFAGYSLEEEGGEIADRRIIPPYRKHAAIVREYLGHPPRKPGRRGDIHATAHGVIVRSQALDLFESASRGKLVTRPTRVLGREDDGFSQVWVLNFVDCLDLGQTISSPPGGFYKDKIGVIKRPAFDESRWDGSDLFVVPEDPSYCYFCTERFVAQWTSARLKGALFSRFLMDPDALRC